MKTKLIISAALIFAATLMSSAAQKKQMLIIYDQMGRELLMPVKPEKETDTIPFDNKTVFRQNRLNALNQVFDLSGITKPEAEIDDIPFNLKEIFEKTSE
jgi:hypothetical protein